MSVAFDDDVDLEIDIGFDASDPFDTTFNWTDVATYGRGLGISRGRSNSTEKMKAGTGAIVFANLDRRFDPLYTSSPYNPNVLPLKPVRIRAVYSSTTYDLFRGYVQGWSNAWGAGGHDAYATCKLVDAFAIFARTRLTTTESQELSGTRLGNLLDDMGWPSGGTWRNIATGDLQMQGVLMDCHSALLELHRVADSDAGVVFMSNDGRVTFQEYDHRSGLSVSATFGDGDASTAKKYVHVVMAYDDRHMHNRVEVTRFGGAAAVASEDTPSINTYGTRVRSYNDMLVVDDSDAGTLASRWLAKLKDPGPRFQELRLEPRSSPSNLWADALGLELSQKINVRRNPPGGGEINQDCYIEGIEHRVSAATKRWSTTFRTSIVE